jgi:hypothetical protein
MYPAVLRAETESGFVHSLMDVVLAISGGMVDVDRTVRACEVDEDV